MHMQEVHTEARQEAAQIALRYRHHGPMPGNSGGGKMITLVGGSGENARGADAGSWRSDEMTLMVASRGGATADFRW